MLPKQAFYHGFALIQGIGPIRLQTILTRARGDITRAWKEFPELARLCLGSTLAEPAITSWNSIDLDDAYARVLGQGISLVCPEDDLYPSLLKEIAQPPITLYYRGRLALPPESITVVGTRRSTDYGRSCTRRLLAPLPAHRVGIVSGLAFGIDAEAHKTALRHGLYTLAVLASGVDIITPQTHSSLAQEIIDAGGCLLSEVLPGTQPSEGSFPRRNRILAGLTRMTLVVEAILGSGSLITAKNALESNRDVGVVPGPIFAPSSAGCFALLKEGAHLVQSSQDLLDVYNVSAGSPLIAPSLTAEEATLIALLEQTPLSLDAILAKSGGLANHTMALLTELELKGLVRSVPGHGFALEA